MSLVIVFLQDGKVVVTTPVRQDVSGLSLEEVAAISVPEGVDYFILDSEGLPYNYPQEVWEVSGEGVSIDRGKLSAYLAAEANDHRRELLNLYASTTANWNTDLMLGDISEEDRSKLISWRNWRKAVEAVDTSTASEETPVEFPPHP